MTIAPLALSTAALAVVLGAGMAPALAQSVTCEAYSGGCETGAPVVGEGAAEGTAPLEQGAPAAGGVAGTGAEAATSAGAGTGAGTPAGAGGETGATRGGALPFTGAETSLLVLAGLVAVGGGATLVVAGRRRRTV